MSQIKFYKYAISGLLLLNIAMLAFFVLTKPRSGNPPPPSNFESEAIRILDLNSEQIATFERLVREHNQMMRAIDEKQRELIIRYFESLSDTSLSVEELDVLNSFEQSEREKIKNTHVHLEEVKSILNNDQLPNFDIFMNDFLQKLFRRR